MWAGRRTGKGKRSTRPGRENQADPVERSSSRNRYGPDPRISIQALRPVNRRNREAGHTTAPDRMHQAVRKMLASTGASTHGVIAAPEPQAPGPAPNRPPPGRRSSSCDTGRPYPSRPLAAHLLGGSLRLPPRAVRAGSCGDRPASQPAPRSGGHGGAARRPTRRLDTDQPCNPSIPISSEASDPDAERELPPGRPNQVRPRSRYLAASLNSVKVSVQIDAT